MTALDTRIAKLERLQGDRGVPSEDEFQEANALLQQRVRAFLALIFAEVSDHTPEPEVVSFYEAAETGPRFAAAEDVVKRYRRGKGYPEMTEERFAAMKAYFDEVIASMKAAVENNGTR